MKVVHTCATSKIAKDWVIELKKRNPKARYTVKKEKLPTGFSSYKYGYVVYKK